MAEPAREPLTPCQERFPLTIVPAADDEAEFPRTLMPPESDEPSDGFATILDFSRRDTASLPRVPGYEILEELGRGGMGVVYKARQLGLNRLVALKMILGGTGGAQERTRFTGEAEAIARLQHPNIVQIYEIGEFEGQLYFSLEFIEGGSLDRHLLGVPQPARESARLLRTLAVAIEAAHSQGIIHRDLKPANILLAKSEIRNPKSEKKTEISVSDFGFRISDLEPKVTDFGLAKRLDDDSGQTRSGVIVGTPSYMAPEQAEGLTNAIGPATDVYSLGAILYEMLTGRPPFKGLTVWETLDQVRQQEPVPPGRLQPKVPRDLETICLKSLEKKSQHRYASARDLADDLDRFLAQKPVLARRASPLERLVKWTRRSPMTAAVVAVGIGFIVASMTALYVRLESARKGAALFQKRAELLEVESRLQQRELAEQKRLADVRTRFEALYARAENADRTHDWPAVIRLTGEALALIENETTFANHWLREPASRLRAKAEGETASARERDAIQGRLLTLRQHHGDAVFFSTLFTGLELAGNFDRVCTSSCTGRSLFGVELDGRGPADADPRFFKPEERLRINALCYELLLMEAEVLAQPRAGEKKEAWHGRLRQALALLDRGERLGIKTRAGLARRADYLDKLDRPQEARIARTQAADILLDLPSDFFLAGMDRYRDYTRHGETRDLKEAARLLSGCLQKQPGHYGALYLLAVCRVQEGRWQDAKTNLSACLEQRPDFRWPLLLRGFASMELGEWESAEKDYDEILASPPDAMARYVAHVNRGVLAVKRRDLTRAIAELEQAIALNPDAAPAYLNLALVHKRRAELPPWQPALLALGTSGLGSGANDALLTAASRDAWRDAVTVLDRAIARRDRVPAYYQERGRLHLLLGESAKARADLARAIVLAPSATAALAGDLIELGRLLHQSGEHRTAVDVFDAVLKLRPDQFIAHRLRAEPLLALNRHADAGQALDRYLELVPKPDAHKRDELHRLSETYKARGLIHARANDFRSAIASYTQGLQIESDADLLVLRGWAYLVEGAPMLALADFEDTLGKEPAQGEALIGRADARIKLGDPERALRDVEAGLASCKHTSRLLYNAARVHAQVVSRGGRTRADIVEQSRRRSIELLQQALARVPANERAAFWRNCVEKDSALAALAHLPEIVRLSSEIKSR